MDPFLLFKNEPNAVPFTAGQVIFRAGDAADVMYGILEGEVQLELSGRVVAILKAGDIFGEMALLEKTCRVATAIAHTDCRLAAINEKRFLSLIQTTPFFALHVLRVLASRLRHADLRLCVDRESAG